MQVLISNMKHTICAIVLSLTMAGCAPTQFDNLEFNLDLPCAKIGTAVGKFYISSWYQDTCDPINEKYFGFGHYWESF